MAIHHGFHHGIALANYLVLEGMMYGVLEIKI
jgi:hypothetical protein